MKPLSISVSELSLPDPGSLSSLSTDEVWRLLTKTALRGRIVGLVLFAVGLGGLNAAVTVYHNLSLAFASSFASALFGIVFVNSVQKLGLANCIVAEPRLVYWAHLKVLRQTVAWRTFDTDFITLYLRNGGVFEVGMSREHTCSILIWLRQHNPEIRLGAYDNEVTGSSMTS